MTNSERNGDSVAEQPNNVEIVLGVCSLRDIPYKFMDCLIRTISQGVIREYSSVQSTLLPQARNKVIQQIFENNETFTHVLLVDDDMCNFDGGDIIKLVEANKDVVTATCVQRKPPYKIVNIMHEEHNLIKFLEEGSVQPVKACGTAFTLIKRHVLEELQEDTPDGAVWFTMDRSPRETFEQELQELYEEVKDKDAKEILMRGYSLGRTAHIGTSLLGEDIAFCRTLLLHGIQPYCHYGVHVGHLGDRVCEVIDAIKAAKERGELV